jgi:aryl-alcohol dehydrogenase (NADP+)
MAEGRFRADALNSLVTAGKVRYLGASNLAAWQLCKALYVARGHGFRPFVSTQNHYNLVYREEEREMIPLCLDQGLAVLPWSPLARGFLTGSRKPEGGSTMRSKADSFAREMYFADEDFDITGAVAQIADERGLKPAQIALAWVLQAPGVTAPIIGATKTEQLAELIAAVAIQLAPSEIARLEAPYRPHRVLGRSGPPRRPATQVHANV